MNTHTHTYKEISVLEKLEFFESNFKMFIY